MEEIVFSHCKPFTLGVELEFQILDQHSLDLVSKAPALLEKAPAEIQGKISPEFLQSMLEIQTGVCASVDEVAADLKNSVAIVEEVAAKSDCLLYSASLHPFAEPTDQLLSVGERYRRIMDELQYVGRQFISQGLHVHVGIEDREQVIRACDIMQVYLPLLLGLSGSSPFFRGEDTGLCSYRTKLFEVLPLAGIAGYIGSWQGYVDEIHLLREAQVIREIKDLWWDVRPSPGFGTVEVRACDLPIRFIEVLGLTSLIQALAVAAVEGRVKPARISPQLLRCNKWQAARHGLEGRFNDPLGLLSTKMQTVREAVEEILIVLRPFLEALGGRGLDAIQHLLDGRISAQLQRDEMKETGSFTAVISRMQERYWHE